MKNNVSENDFVKITKVSEKKIFFESKLPWALCLGADYKEERVSSGKFFLKNNFVNHLKMNYLFPDYSFLKFDSQKTPLDLDVFDKLRNYQKEDVEFLKKLKRIAIFSEMRTGKTPISLIIFRKWNLNSLIIVTPSIIQNQWCIAVEKWLSKPAFMISYLDKNWRHFFYERMFNEDNLVIIISKDTLKNDIDFIKIISKKRKNKFKKICTIVDEAHFLRNYKSLQSKSIFLLDDSEYKIVITGTPIVNHNSDIFGILKFIYPNFFKSYWSFVKKYFVIEKIKINNKKKRFVRKVGDFIDDDKKKQLFSLIKRFSVNRKQKDVFSHLPKLIYQKEILLMDKKQEDVYFSLKKNWRDFNPLEILTKLKTITLFPEYLNENDTALKKNKIDFGVKVNFILNFLNDFDKNHIVIFSTRSKTFIKPLFNIIKEKKKKVGIIIGDTNYEERKKYINLFQEKKINVLLCNIQTSGIGIKLNVADTVIFADRSYSPADNDQAESRFLPTSIEEYNDGSKVKMIIDLVCKNTIDEKILDLIRDKKNISDILKNDIDFLFE